MGLSAHPSLWLPFPALGELAFRASARLQFGNGFLQPRGIGGAASQVQRFLEAGEFLQGHQHGGGLAAVAGDDDGLTVRRHPVECLGEILTELAERDDAHPFTPAPLSVFAPPPVPRALGWRELPRCSPDQAGGQAGACWSACAGLWWSW